MFADVMLPVAVIFGIDNELAAEHVTLQVLSALILE